MVIRVITVQLFPISNNFMAKYNYRDEISKKLIKSIFFIITDISITDK